MDVLLDATAEKNPTDDYYALGHLKEGKMLVTVIARLLAVRPS